MYCAGVRSRLSRCRNDGAGGHSIEYRSQLTISGGAFCLYFGQGASVVSTTRCNLYRCWVASVHRYRIRGEVSLKRELASRQERHICRDDSDMLCRTCIPDNDVGLCRRRTRNDHLPAGTIEHQCTFVHRVNVEVLDRCHYALTKCRDIDWRIAHTRNAE